MIGNDVVDLQLANLESNWQRKGWLQKIFTAAEQEKIHTAKDQNLQVWTFWSMKEAAYKAHQRSFSKKPVFNPTKIECTSAHKVCIDKSTYDVHTTYTNRYVYSIATQYNATHYYSEMFSGTVDLKKQLEQIIFQKTGNTSVISLKKDENGIPHLYTDTHNLQISCSLTHHGKYFAFVLII
ncbi:4-phosphopantetheinyl transferase family protein [Aquimarina sp. U1-2]|uniref:4'-phosphopantetheinyl transferase family protein n=1 Tax=Aquimarina sp. U1-2 TaxID=2823141 RepID=UPI001AEC7EB4|nr:4'-phosphopantetheinyl transferase superfamily protein [Aquimarina sp. U1-2]MBP2831919.1 4-phosphopantetheinyl transferase family protein [Aquimarina sp. U1-2]